MLSHLSQKYLYRLKSTDKITVTLTNSHNQDRSKMKYFKGIILLFVIQSICSAHPGAKEKRMETEQQNIDDSDNQRDIRQTKQNTAAAMPMMTTTPMTTMGMSTMPQLQQMQLANNMAMPRYQNYIDSMYGTGFPGAAGYPGLGLNYPGNNFQQQQQLGLAGFPNPGAIYGNGINGFNQPGFIDPQMQAQNQNPNYFGLNNVVNLANLAGLQQQSFIGSTAPLQSGLAYPQQQLQQFPQQYPQQLGQQIGSYPMMGPLNNGPLGYGEAFQNYL